MPADRAPLTMFAAMMAASGKQCELRLRYDPKAGKDELTLEFEMRIIPESRIVYPEKISVGQMLSTHFDLLENFVLPRLFSQAKQGFNAHDIDWTFLGTMFSDANFNIEGP